MFRASESERESEGDTVFHDAQGAGAANIMLITDNSTRGQNRGSND